MLVVPPLIPPDAQGSEKLVSPSGQLKGGGGRMAVRCPLVDGRLIGEAECYDLQALAMGHGPVDWRAATARLYDPGFQTQRPATLVRCLAHQLHIVDGEAGYPAGDRAALVERLADLTS